MGQLNDIVGDLKRMKESAEINANRPFVYVNTYAYMDQHAIEYFKNSNIIVVISTGERYQRGEKMEEENA